MDGLSPFSSHRALFDQLTLLTSQANADVTSLYVLLERNKDAFKNLFSFKAPDAASRQQVQSCRVTISTGQEVALDMEPDVRLALLLSDELKLNEVTCVELLLAIFEERAVFTAESAAGLFFEERRALLLSLEHILQSHAMDTLMGGQGVASPTLNVIMQFNQELLNATTADGRSVLVSRLLQLIRDSSLEAGPGSRLAHVMGEQQAAIPRSGVVVSERSILCRCLFYCTIIKQRLAAPLVAEILDLLTALSRKAHNAAPSEGEVRKQEFMVGMVAVLVLLPQEDNGTSERPALQQLAAAADLTQRIETGHPPEGGYQALVRLAWGLLQAALSRGSSTPQGGRDPTKYWDEATRSGALGFVKGLLGSHFFQGEAADAQQIVVAVLYALVTDLMRYDDRLGRVLEKAMIAATPLDSRTPSSNAMVVASAAPPDNLATLLSLLSAIFYIRPELLLVDADRQRTVDSLVHRVAQCHPDTRQAFAVSTEVRVAFLSLLASLARGEDMAGSIIHQLAKWGESPVYERLSWRHFFGILLQYCRIYSEALARAAAERRYPLPGREEQLMNPKDAQAIVGYLELFRTLVEQGNERQVRVWLEGLRVELRGVLGEVPLHELLFQLMSHPVPNTVKAALDEVLVAMARFPDVAAVFFERLLQAAVVSAYRTEPLYDPHVPKFDLVHQINEVESRQEEYPETIAFLRLMNSLVGTLKGAVPEGGRSVSHLTQFVVDHVLRHLWHRGYKDPQQKWQVASEGFRHLQQVIEIMPGVLGPDFRSSPPPGAIALNDILSGGAAMQTILHVLEPGVEDLISASCVGGAGPRESAVAAALKLLNCVLEHDEAFVAQLAQLQLHERLSTLDAQFRSTQGGIQRLSMVLQYCCYSPDRRVVTAALKVLLLMARRLPHLVELLQQPSFDLTPCYHLREGCTAALKDAMDAVGVGEEAEEGQEDEDERAALVMRIMLEGAVSGAAPHMAHLLLGYNVEPVPGALEEYPLLEKEFTCLRFLLRFLRDNDCCMARLRPRLHTQCLQLLHLMASDPISGPQMVALLQQPHLLEIPAAVLQQPLPLTQQHQGMVYALHQYAWAMRLQAHLLLGSEDKAVVEPLLSSLYPAAAAALMVDPMEATLAQRRSAVRDVLDRVAAVDVPDPMHAAASLEEVRMQEQMSVGEVSVSDLLREEVAVRMGLMAEADTGDLVFDFPALKEQLRVRYDAYMHSNTAGSDDLPRRAVAAAFAYAQRYNASLQLAAGQVAAAASWGRVVQVSFAARYQQLERLAGGGRPAAILYEVLMATLEACLMLGSVRDFRLGPPLGEVVAVLVARLSERAKEGRSTGGEDVLEGVRTPPKCQKLLEQLLSTIEAVEGAAGRGAAELRVQLYQAVLHYLSFCRGSRALTSSPVVLEALMVEGGGMSAAAKVEAAQSEIEQMNAVLIRRAVERTRILEGIRDVASDAAARPQAQHIALGLLGALVAADDEVAVAAAVMAQKPKPLPGVLLDGLPDAARHALQLGGAKSQKAVGVVNAQLSLLLELTKAGSTPQQRQSSAQQMFSLQVISRLTAMDALSFQPSSSMDRSPSSLRSRLHQILAPALRLLEEVLAGLPDSLTVRSQALGFVEAHALALSRILEELAAAGPSGDMELEEGELVMVVLAQLAPHMKGDGPNRTLYLLQRAVLTAAREFLGSAPSHPLLSSVGEGWTPELTTRYKRVARLRGAMVHWVLEVVSGGLDPQGLLRMVGGEGNMRLEAAAGAPRPTLFFIQDTTRQAARELVVVGESLQKALQQLRLPADALTDDEVSQILLEFGAPLVGHGVGYGSRRKAARQQLAAAAGSLDGQMRRLLYLAETSLAVIVIHFVRCLPRPYPKVDTTNGSSGSSGVGPLAVLLPGGSSGRDAAGTPRQEDAEVLGSRQEFQIFFARLRDTCNDVAGVVEAAEGIAGHNLQPLSDLLREVQAYLTQY